MVSSPSNTDMCVSSGYKDTMEDSRQVLVNSVEYGFQEDVNKDPPADVPVNTRIIDCGMERGLPFGKSAI